MGTWDDEYHNLNVIMFDEYHNCSHWKKQEHLNKSGLKMKTLKMIFEGILVDMCSLHLQAGHFNLTKLLKLKRSEICLVVLFGQDLSEY